MKRARPKNKRQAEKKLKEQTKAKYRNEGSASVEAAYGKKNGKKPVGKILLGILLAIVVFILIVMGFGLFDESQILAPLEDGKINVLLLGVDEDGLRSDTIMVASYDVNEAKVNMLSVPRDTKIYIQNRKMTRKINEIHAISSKEKTGEILGAEAMAEVVTQLTGIPINYYVEFSFSSIDRLFDILGPVEFDVPDIEGKGRGMNYDDPVQNLSIHLKPGLQKLSGNQIQQFLRYRKSNYGVGTGSDTDRIARQQELLKAVIDQKVNVSILVKLPSIFSQISKEIITNVTAGDITKYIRYAAKLSGESVNAYSLPGENKTISGGSYFVCNLDETALLMQETFGIDAEGITDKVTVSDTHSQKILKAGNMTKVSGKDKKEETPEPAKTSTPSPTPTPTPTATPTQAPTKAPVVTKSPSNSPAPTKTPLEDLDDDFEVIEE